MAAYVLSRNRLKIRRKTMKHDSIQTWAELVRSMNALAVRILSSGERICESEELIEMSRRAAELTEEDMRG